MRVLYRAAIDCQHSIDSDQVTLHRNPNLPGNALSQLADRLDAEEARLRSKLIGGPISGGSSVGDHVSNLRLRAKPEFITFTGADSDTDINEMLALSDQYPIEWGILFSPKLQGTGRYPALSTIKRIASTPGFRLAAHICGGDARAVIAGGAFPHDGLVASYFLRAQINTADPEVDPSRIKSWADRLGVRAILQCRESFPGDQNVDYLYDTSGGRGDSPLNWPDFRASKSPCGYAGGLNPDNVAAQIKRFAPESGRYWIDMESGVRDDLDRFSLEKCRAVCENVYGERS